jgi:uncharacterized protein DUF2188
MHDGSDRDVYYRVTRTRSGQWEVSDPALDRAIASFSDKADAFDYARRLTEVTKWPEYGRIRSAGYRVS